MRPLVGHMVMAMQPPAKAPAQETPAPAEKPILKTAPIGKTKKTRAGKKK